MINCQKCGAALRDDATFCMNCGTKVIITAPEPTSKEIFIAEVNELCKLANDLSAKYVDGMSAMEANVTIAKEKTSAEVSEMKATLARETEKNRTLSASLEDAMSAVRNLNAEKENLLGEIASLKSELAAIKGGSPAPADPTTTTAEAVDEPAAADPAIAPITPVAPANAGTNFCPECGSPYSDGMFYCNECGCKLK